MNLFFWRKLTVNESDRDSVTGRKNFNTKKFKKKSAIISLILVVAIVCGCFFAYTSFFGSDEKSRGLITAQASIGQVSSVIEGSGVIEAIEQYDITSLKKGEIIADYFKEGDIVEEGSILYQMDDEDGQKMIKNAKETLEKAQKNYDDAVENLNELAVRSETDGVITNMYISVGDNVNSNSKIADVVNSSKMILEIQFLSDYIGHISVGSSATVTLSKNGSVLSGNVSRVSSGYVLNSMGAKVANVEITVSNPGSVEAGDYATAQVGEYACSSEGTFRYSSKTSIYSKTSGEVVSLKCISGDNIQYGNTIAILKNTSLNDGIEDALDSLKEAQEKYEEALEALEDYTVTAPISGKIIQKNIKAGENLEDSASSSMATIADLSSLVFSMSVDELDVMKIDVGMEVDIKADAIENVTFIGEVTNVSIMGTSQNGVTSYPVEISINPANEQTGRAREIYDDLIPGLNVSAQIVIEKAENVLVVPVSAVRRGNIVIIKADSDSEGIGFNGSASNFDKRENPVHNSDADIPAFAPNDRQVPSDGKMPRKNKNSDTSSDEDKQNSRLQAMIDALDIPDGYKAVIVQTGLSDERFIEIKDGISEGDTVVLPDTTSSATTAQTPRMGSGMMGSGMMGGRTGGNMGRGPGGMR